MKKILVILMVMGYAAFTYTAIAQCTPDPSYTVAGYYPSSLPDAFALVPYSATITVVVPATYSIYPIDSVRIMSVTGLPAGISYQTNKPNNKFNKSETGCILISGTTDKTEIGSNPLVLNVTVYGMGLAVPTPVTNFSIMVNDTILSGIAKQPLSQKFEVFQNFPNPVTDKTKLSFNSPAGGEYTVQILNMVGSMVYNEKVSAKRGINEIVFDRENLLAGMYFYKISDGVNVITKRMIIKD